MRLWRTKHGGSYECLTPSGKLKSNARGYLHVYVKRGKVKKLPCEVCGDLVVHGHHEDYTKPLAVRWLCKLHHLQLHGKMLPNPLHP